MGHLCFCIVNMSYKVRLLKHSGNFLTMLKIITFYMLEKKKRKK